MNIRKALPQLRRISSTLFLSSLFFITPLSAQTSLSLQDAVNRAVENSWEFKMAEADRNSAHAQFRQANAAFLPQLSVSNTAVRTNNPLQAFGILLQQETVTAADFNPAVLNDPDNRVNYNTRVEVQQPLLNLNALKGRSAARKMLDARESGLHRTQQMVVLQTKSAYFGYALALEQIQVLEGAVSAASANLQVAENLLSQGIIKEVDLMNAQVHEMNIRNQLRKARGNAETALMNLNYWVRLDSSELIVSDSLEQFRAVSPLVDARVPENRSDLLALKSAVEARSEMLKSSQGQFVPNLAVFGSYEWNDDELTGFGANNYVMGATLRWDIFKGGQQLFGVQKSRAEYEKTKLEYQQKKNQAELELSEARTQAAVAFAAIDISEKALQKSREAYRITQNRFEQGMEKTADLLASEAQLREAELNYLNSLYQYANSLFQLEFLTQNSTP